MLNISGAFIRKSWNGLPAFLWSCMTSSLETKKWDQSLAGVSEEREGQFGQLLDKAILLNCVKSDIYYLQLRQ